MIWGTEMLERLKDLGADSAGYLVEMGADSGNEIRFYKEEILNFPWDFLVDFDCFSVGFSAIF